MAADELPKGFRPSLLDKLTDPNSGGTADRPGLSLTAMKAAVQRDLEHLLNTRRPSEAGLGIDGLHQVERSIVNYGLPDLSQCNPLIEGDRERVRREVAAAIEFFEPRLADVEVLLKNIREIKDELKGSFQHGAVYLNVSAKLRMDPHPPIAFDTVVDLTGGRHRVEEGGG